MKKILSLTLALWLGLGTGFGATSNEGRKATGETMPLEREITLDRGNYTALSVGNTIHVVLEENRDPRHIRVETENISADRLEARLLQNTLELTVLPNRARRARRDGYREQRITVYVGIGAIESFQCTGASSVFYEGSVKRPVVRVSASGISELDMGIECDALYLELESSSVYRGACSCTGRANLTLSGVSKLLSDLDSRELALELSGSSEFQGDIACREHAGIEVSGVSELRSNVSCQDLALQLEGSSSYGGDIRCGNACHLTMSGCSEADGSIDGRTVDLQMQSSSQFSGRIQCADTTKIVMEGVSECRPSGYTPHLVLETSGSSDFRGREFVAQESAECLLNNVSKADLTCNGELNFQVGRSSSFQYGGTPHISEVKIDGGSVRTR